jgi:hypothetical protein
MLIVICEVPLRGLQRGASAGCSLDRARPAELVRVACSVTGETAGMASLELAVTISKASIAQAEEIVKRLDKNRKMC